MKENGLLLILSGPSGVGKGTVVQELIRRNSNITVSVSMTTRAPRPGEVEGESYYFVTKEDFLSRLSKGEMLEHSNHFENYYGTPKQFVLDSLKEKDVLLEIDVNGGLEVKKNFPSAVLIMIVPPSREEIRNRLIKRNTETIEKINSRMERIDYELSKKDLYDYAVVNDKLQDALTEIEEIIKNEKQKG